MPVHEIKRAPLLTDIAGRLRFLADQLEKGNVEADLALVVLRGPTQPHTFCYGDYASVDECNGILLRAAIDKD